MKRTHISLGAAFFGAFIAWLIIVVFLPELLYVETAYNIVVFSFAGGGVVTSMVLWLRARKQRVALGGDCAPRKQAVRNTDLNLVTCSPAELVHADEIASR